MSGYTPVFNSVLDGTLYGRWPHTGIWMCLLSQCDRHGNIDMVPGLLAAKIGVPVDTLMDCIADFMLPDPGSRTVEHEGRRLELLDAKARSWGWRVLNHSAYRERARKQAYDSKRTATGADAERKRMSRDVPTRPALSRSQTHTQTHTQTETLRGDARGEPRATRSAANRLPEDFQLTDPRKDYAVAQGIDPQRTLEDFRDYWTSSSGAKARKHDWDATWRMWCRNQAGRGSGSRPRKTRFEEIFNKPSVGDQGFG